MLSFALFPPELQRAILNNVVESSESLASYACVNQEWRSFIEAKTFRNLIIHQDDIAVFGETVTEARRPHVKHLWLRILLPEYPYPVFKEEETSAVRWQADRTFTTSVFTLWDILAEWDTQGHGKSPALTLEISAHSPSDTGDYGGGHIFQEDVEHYRKYLATNSTEPYITSRDVHSSYIKLHESLGMTGNTFVTQIRDQWWARTVNDLLGWKPIVFNHHQEESFDYLDDDKIPILPQVPVITGFLVRRQQFREIYPEVFGEMISSMPRLEDVNVERWRCAESRDEKSWCQAAKVNFCMELPPSVNRLSLYADTSDIFHQWTPSHVNTIALAKSLRLYGKHLEHISVSFLIDAKHFFEPFWGADSDRTTKDLPDWVHLKTLSLTSSILASDSPEDINELLCAAARAVRKMPSLQTLELWNGQAGQACVFRYRVVDTVTEIVWRGTNVTTMNTAAKNAWTETSLIHGRSDLRSEESTLDPDKITSAGSALSQLVLGDKILHPVSRYRMTSTCIGRVNWE
ncbi:hypothetical protein FZEAL_8217 [Fusarium zealandicum]|uniref:DUF6546 domain-containing protein n=1 Tax=Fusarium zealandicum TaxID=1053134 RepID=A0A8H4UEZ0_9HYPO|nr:hypothetical protein FZEAL_8217 [Fusarium zealandicum]